MLLIAPLTRRRPPPPAPPATARASVTASSSSGDWLGRSIILPASALCSPPEAARPARTLLNCASSALAASESRGIGEADHTPSPARCPPPAPSTPKGARRSTTMALCLRWIPARRLRSMPEEESSTMISLDSCTPELRPPALALSSPPALKESATTIDLDSRTPELRPPALAPSPPPALEESSGPAAPRSGAHAPRPG